MNNKSGVFLQFSCRGLRVKNHPSSHFTVQFQSKTVPRCCRIHTVCNVRCADRICIWGGLWLRLPGIARNRASSLFQKKKKEIVSEPLRGLGTWGPWEIQ
jgi:hypothetical protein